MHASGPSSSGAALTPADSKHIKADPRRPHPQTLVLVVHSLATHQLTALPAAIARELRSPEIKSRRAASGLSSLPRACTPIGETTGAFACACDPTPRCAYRRMGRQSCRSLSLCFDDAGLRSRSSPPVYTCVGECKRSRYWGWTPCVSLAFCCHSPPPTGLPASPPTHSHPAPSSDTRCRGAKPPRPEALRPLLAACQPITCAPAILIVLMSLHASRGSTNKDHKPCRAPPAAWVPLQAKPAAAQQSPAQTPPPLSREPASQIQKKDALWDPVEYRPADPHSSPQRSYAPRPLLTSALLRAWGASPGAGHQRPPPAPPGLRRQGTARELGLRP